MNNLSLAEGTTNNCRRTLESARMNSSTLRGDPPGQHRVTRALIPFKGQA